MQPISLRGLFLIPLFLSAFFLFSTNQTNEDAEQYIKNYKNDAIKEMKAHGIPASIILAQGLLESSYGKSKLAVNANNHFGIKCHNYWTGEKFIQDDDAEDECFRKYKTVLESYSDHTAFLKTRQRYAFLFELKTTDYKGWAKGLSKAGYATDPKYSDKLINIIENYKLYQLDSNSKHKPTSNSNLTPTHEVKRNNRVKYITIKKGDTFYSIGKEFDISLTELYSYNDCDSTYILSEGEKIYLGVKRRKSKIPFHVVKDGESLHRISQEYAVTIKAICKKNKLPKNKIFVVGEKIWLRKQK
ncbi:MAG: glucosaminidase domain-containing protein [Bacteroidetes bacterium]|nr:glucosaminidase domain-containing protein [Bacteroidota bacterium]